MNRERNEKDSNNPIAVQRNYKDTLFRMIFDNPDKLLQLYNAVNDTDYQNPAELKIVTLENAIYMNVKNDLAFIIDCRMSLYEQQASVNPNMPLRNLFYVSKEYQGMVSQKSLYSSRLIKLPTPYFVVFYNGTPEQPERKIMKLSDSFLTDTENPALELTVVQLNIGQGHNRELMAKCPLLEQYSKYVGRVQLYASQMPLAEAVELAVSECIREQILSDFLQKNRAEAIAVSIFEYDEEKELALLRQAEREEGWEAGQREGWKTGHQKGLETGRREGLETGRQEGKLQQLLSLARKQLLPVKTAAQEAGMSEEQFLALLKN